MNLSLWPKPSYWAQTFLSTSGTAVPIFLALYFVNACSHLFACTSIAHISIQRYARFVLEMTASLLQHLTFKSIFLHRLGMLNISMSPHSGLSDIPFSYNYYQHGQDIPLHYPFHSNNLTVIRLIFSLKNACKCSLYFWPPWYIP